MLEAVGHALEAIAARPLLLWSLLTLGSGLPLLQAYRRGQTSSKYGTIEKASSPIMFWLHVAIWGAIFALSVFKLGHELAAKLFAP